MTTAALITKTYNTTAFSQATLTFRADGYFNLTSAAKAFGKRLDNFWGNAETTAYMLEVAVSEKLIPLIGGITPRVPAFGTKPYQELKASLVDTQRGHFSKPTTGTWAHPKLAMFFARWLDAKFALWCDAVIEDILKGHQTLQMVNKAESAVAALPADVLAAGAAWQAEMHHKIQQDDYLASI